MNFQIFPTILIVLDIAAAFESVMRQNDVAKCIYWIAAATLTFVVTYPEVLNK